MNMTACPNEVYGGSDLDKKTNNYVTSTFKQCQAVHNFKVDFKKTISDEDLKSGAIIIILIIVFVLLLLGLCLFWYRY